MAISAPAYADQETGAALLGAVAGAMLEHTMDHMNDQPLQQQQQQPAPHPQIQWNDPVGGRPMRQEAEDDPKPVPRPHVSLAHQKAAAEATAKAAAIAKAENESLAQIQADLKSLGFLDNASGAADTKTTVAIKAWQTAFNLPADGKMTDKQKDLLHLAAGGEFKTGDEYDAATKLGFGYETAYAAFKTSGFSTKAEFDDAQHAGFDTKNEMLAAKAAGFSTAADYKANQIKPVQVLIGDLQAFLPTYKEPLDKVFITSCMKTLAPINDGKWSDDMQTTYADLKSYAEKLPGFTSFEQQQVQKRQAESDTVKANLIHDIESARAFSDQFLRTHLTDTRAITLAETIAKLPAPDMTTTMPDLETLSQKTNRPDRCRP